MRVSDFDIPAGQTFKKVRDFLSRHTHPTLFGSDDVTKHFGVDITAELVAKGLIEPHHGKFQISPLGTRLAAKQLNPRIPRAKAEKIVADMLSRARNINESPELLCRISKITVFGSFVTDAEDLGDIDVSVEIKRKHVEGMQWIEAAVARAKASGRQLDYSQMLDYPRHEVMRLLKDRNRYIQFCSPIMLEGFDTPKRVIFSDETN
jgi:predicted nucleotidyltransferase